jgi:hypothetical protein
MRPILILTVFFILTYTKVSGQDSLSKCKKDTLHLILAYELANQWHLDDMIYRNPEFVIYESNGISLKSYEKGVFDLLDDFYSEQTLKKFSICKIDLRNDTTIAKFRDYSFYNMPSKIWSKTNKTFAGKGETQLGYKIKIPPLTFQYTLFDMTFVAINTGLEKRRIVNIDRQSKHEEETVTINCPVYYIIQIIDLKKIE